MGIGESVLVVTGLSGGSLGKLSRKKMWLRKHKNPDFCSSAIVYIGGKTEMSVA